MKISVRGMGSRSLLAKLEKLGITELVGGAINELFFESVWPNTELEEFLRQASRHGAFDLNPWMTFDRKDYKIANFLKLRPRKTVEESNADYEKMQESFDRLPLLGDDPLRQFVLPQHLFLSRRINLKPNQVAAIGQWTAEYIVTATVRKLLEASELSGIQFRPIMHTRTGSPHEDYFHLHANHTLGFRELDLASPIIDSVDVEDQSYRNFGCLCYDSETLESALDFNRTGEPIAGFRLPGWVVRSSVRSFFLENKLRGWAFDPVLETETQAYEDYNELWTSFYRVLNECDTHTIRNEKVATV